MAGQGTDASSPGTGPSHEWEQSWEFRMIHEPAPLPHIQFSAEEIMWFASFPINFDGIRGADGNPGYTYPDPENPDGVAGGTNRQADVGSYAAAPDYEIGQFGMEAYEKLKEWSVTVTNRHRGVTELIKVRNGAEKYETNMAAGTQVIALHRPASGDPSDLIFPVKTTKDANATDDEKATFEMFQRDIAVCATDLDTLNAVWKIFEKAIDYAATIGAKVFEKGQYGPPNSIPWIEFIAIATLIAKAWLVAPDALAIIIHEDGEHDAAMLEILQEISCLRRYLRCNLARDGFRRSNKDWAVCWKFLESIGSDDDGTLEIAGSQTLKNGSVFVFPEEPELWGQ